MAEMQSEYIFNPPMAKGEGGCHPPKGFSTFSHTLFFYYKLLLNGGLTLFDKGGHAPQKVFLTTVLIRLGVGSLNFVTFNIIILWSIRKKLFLVC